MDSVLILSNTNTTLGIISDLLNSQPFSRIVTAQNCAEARRDLISDQFDLIIVDSPLPDEFGDDFSLYAAEQTDAGIILIVNNDKVYDISPDIEDAGVFVLPKPVSPEFFYQAVKLLIASRKRVQVLENENVKLQKKIDEIRLIDRAKCILIQYLQMTEPQAHKYIEKQAMNLRQSRLQTAESQSGVPIALPKNTDRMTLLVCIADESRSPDETAALLSRLLSRSSPDISARSSRSSAPSRSDIACWRYSELRSPSARFFADKTTAKLLHIRHHIQKSGKFFLIREFTEDQKINCFFKSKTSSVQTTDDILYIDSLIV